MSRGKTKIIFSAYVCGILFYSNPGNANIVTIDFNDLATGTDVSNQYASQGVTFSLIGSSLPGPNTFALVDGSTPLNIFGATGNAINPGDDHRDPFWDIQIDFAMSIEYFSILALDAEESFTVRIYDDLNPIGTATNSLVGNRSSAPFRGPVYMAEFGFVGSGVLFNRVVIDVVEGSSGGTSGGPELFDNVQYSAVPEPSSLALWCVALGGIGYLQKRLKTERPV